MTDIVAEYTLKSFKLIENTCNEFIAKLKNECQKLTHKMITPHMIIFTSSLSISYKYNLSTCKYNKNIKSVISRTIAQQTVSCEALDMDNL